MTAVFVYALLVTSGLLVLVAAVALPLLVIRLFHRLCGRPVIWIVLRWVVCLPVLLFRGIVDVIVMILEALVFVLLQAPLWFISGLDHLCRLLRPLAACVWMVIAVAIGTPLKALLYALLQGQRWCLSVLLGLYGLMRRSVCLFSRVIAASGVMIFHAALTGLIYGPPLALKLLTGLPGFIRRVCEIIPVAPEYLLLLCADLWAARRGQATPDGEPDEAAPEPPAPNPVPRTFLDARRALGLPGTFTPAMFKQAYRAAMKHAHPDLGGTAEAAHAVSEAAAIIRRHKGWA